jgi:DNA-binding MarR family transcriptional regulator
MDQSQTRKIAQMMMEVMPLMMRVWSAEIRVTADNPSPAHVAVLGMLQYRPFTLSDLADRHAVTSPTMSNTINVLEERGWVARRRSTEDRRLVWIEITDEGRAKLAQMNDEIVARVAALLDRMTPQQRQTLLDGMIVLNEVFVAAVNADPVLAND